MAGIHDSRIFAYIDDRTMVARSSESLQEMWARSQVWEQQHGWSTNLAKTGYVALRDTPTHISNGSITVEPSSSIVLLGPDVGHAKGPRKKQIDRIPSVLEAAIRLQRLRLAPAVTNQAVATAVMTKLTYGFQSTRLPNKTVRQVTSAVKRALGVSGRMRCWELVEAFGHQFHGVGPPSVLAYTHIMNVVRAMKQCWAKRIWFAPPLLQRHGVYSLYRI